MKKTKGLHGWIRQLEGSQAAALAGLVKELDRVTASEDSSAIQLSNLILKDASLTSHIIRIGNSIQFNPSSTPVTTVSRAIVNIGFKHVRSVCLAVKVMDMILSDGGSDLLFSRLATSLHAAHQTRALCSKYNETQKEEAFVASLLSNLVELLILSSGEEEAREFAQKLNFESTVKDRNQVSEEVLGVRLDTLSKTLMKRWRIDGLINDYYEPGALDQRLKAMKLGDEIAVACLAGWSSSAFKTALKQTVKHTGLNGEVVRAQIKAATEVAQGALEEFGDERVSRSLPEAGASASHKIEIETKGASASSEERAGSEAEGMHSDGFAQKDVSHQSSANEGDSHDLAVELLQPDPGIQLEAISQMSEMMLGQVKLNAFFELLLKGLHQGAGFERSAFFLLDARVGQFTVKLVSGDKTEDWKMSLRLPNDKQAESLVSELFASNTFQCVEIKTKSDGLSGRQAQSLAYKTGVDAFMLAPLALNGKRVGLLYCDMGLSKRDIDQAKLTAFQQLYLQARLGLNALASRS